MKVFSILRRVWLKAVCFPCLWKIKVLHNATSPTNNPSNRNRISSLTIFQNSALIIARRGQRAGWGRGGLRASFHIPTATLLRNGETISPDSFWHCFHFAIALTTLWSWDVLRVTDIRKWNEIDLDFSLMDSTRSLNDWYRFFFFFVFFPNVNWPLGHYMENTLKLLTSVCIAHKIRVHCLKATSPWSLLVTGTCWSRELISFTLNSQRMKGTNRSQALEIIITVFDTLYVYEVVVVNRYAGQWILVSFNNEAI